jgi:hypothetical protein
MEGFGGELFVAPPSITGDLLGSLRMGAAIRSARSFRDAWVYGYADQAKASLRAKAPRWVLTQRERRRRLPPWARRDLRAALDPVQEPRSARDHRPWFLLWEGRNGARDAADAVGFPDGVRSTYPFYDRRVIRAAMHLPTSALVPHPEPKWVLREAILGSWAESRMKAIQEGWFRAVARRTWTSHPTVFLPTGRLAAAGLVDPAGSVPPFESRWELQSSTLVFLDAALRAAGTRHAQGPAR